MTLGETIARLRTEKNMSQSDLAGALDVSRQSVSKWETDSSVPELGKLVQLSELFGLTLDELVKGKANEPVSPETTEPDQPSLQPTPADHLSPEVPALHTKKIISIILLCLGAALTLLALALDWAWFTPVFVLPLFILGGICLMTRKHTGLKWAWAAYFFADLFLRFGTGRHWTDLIDLISLRLSGNTPMAESMVQVAPLAIILAGIEFALLLLLLFFTVYSYRNEPCEPTKRRVTWLIIGWAAYVVLRLILPLFLQDQRPVDQLIAHFAKRGQAGIFVIVYQIFLSLKDCAFLILFACLIVTTLGVWRWKREKQ
ncbi:MAG: helix-turn-helix transcriptional regulator [Firmicutes bacterium]|nr:helix-turn-helix transcriptional regulator [Bacillota bacterium]